MDPKHPSFPRPSRAHDEAAVCDESSDLARSLSEDVTCRFCRTTPNASDPNVCHTLADANKCPWSGHIRESKSRPDR